MSTHLCVVFLLIWGYNGSEQLQKKVKKACKAENIYYLFPYRKGLPTPV